MKQIALVGSVCRARLGCGCFGSEDPTRLRRRWGGVDNVGHAASMGDKAGDAKYQLENVGRLLDFLDECATLTGVVTRYALRERSIKVARSL